MTPLIAASNAPSSGLAPATVGGIAAAIVGVFLLAIGAMCAYIFCFTPRTRRNQAEEFGSPELELEDYRHRSINSPPQDIDKTGDRASARLNESPTYLNCM